MCIWVSLLVTAEASAQRRLDTLRLDSIRLFPKSRLMSGLVKKGVDAITRDPEDTTPKQEPQNAKNENPFLRYDGRHIRHIYIKNTGLQRRASDTSKKLTMLALRVMNALHTDTKEKVVRNNLFIREGQPADAVKLAENERYLRTLEYIQDARIVVVPVSADTIDIEVVTKDVFSLSGGIDISSLQHLKADASEANLAGLGHKVKFVALIHQDRDPVLAYRAQYTMNNIGGSFINGSAGYSTASPTLFDGKEEERGYFAALDRPLVSTTAKFAGGVYYAYRISEQAYNEGRPENLFYDYTLHTFDAWIGYNLASGRLNDNKIRDRRFISLRYMQNEFVKTPYQVKGFDPVFNNTQAVLGQITFFRQDFYKTSYIYGFGITEDIPSGYNISLVGGWQRQLDLGRPYAGIRADKYYVAPGGAFYRFYLRTGAYYKAMQLEDAGILLGTNIFSRLVQWNRTRVRQYASFSYAGLFNRRAGDLLRINNPFGLHEFNYADITGDQRIGLLSETSFFLRYRFLGFKFAPFVTGNAVIITPQLGNFRKADIYTGIGGGIRTRNESLVFGTVELRGIYFPRKVEGQPEYKILLTTDLRYRYNSNYVNKPDITRLNTDDGL